MAVSPLRGGSLTFAYGYSETLDTGGDQLTRTHGPTLRWNIRPGWFFNGSYSFLDSAAPSQTLSSRGLSLNLVIRLL